MTQSPPPLRGPQTMALVFQPAATQQDRLCELLNTSCLDSVTIPPAGGGVGFAGVAYCWPDR